MRLSHLILPAVGLSALAWSFLNGIDGHAQPAPRVLPGATPTVEAIHFPTIQAALDALPPTGGVVRLPTGTFEASKRLRVSRGDVLLDGAGTATHLNERECHRARDVQWDRPARRALAAPSAPTPSPSSRTTPW